VDVPKQPARRPGRRPGVSATRDEILSSARALFAADGYEATSIRAVARGANVDPGLVLHYFRDKEHLIGAAMDVPLDPEDAVARIVPGPRTAVGRRLVAYFLSIWEDPVQREPLMGMLRGATTSPQVASLLREVLVERVLGPVGAQLGQEDGALRMALCSSQLIGLGVARYILLLEPVASLSTEDTVRLVGPTLQRYMTGKL
jgi:AcrR family transcriptional regulator